MAANLLKHPLIGIFTLFLLIVLAWFVHMGNGIITQDILVYRQAGVELIHGRNPYQLPLLSDYFDFRNYQTGLYDEVNQKLQIWVPPSSLFIPVFLSLVPGQLLPALNFCLLIVGQLLSWLVARQFMPKEVALRPSPYYCIFYLLLASPAIIDYIGWGSINSFQTIPWLIFILTFLKGSDAIAGTFLAFCAFKPQLVFLPLIIFFWVGRKFLSRRLITAFLIAILLLCLLPFTLYSDLFSAYRNLDRTILEIHAQYAVTLPGVLSVLSAGGLQIALALSIFFSISILLWFRARPAITCRHDLVGIMLVAILPGLICSPYLWLHDYLIASPCFMIVSGAFAIRGSIDSKLLAAALLASILVVGSKMFSFGVSFDVFIVLWLICSCVVTILCKRQIDCGQLLTYHSERYINKLYK